MQVHDGLLLHVIVVIIGCDGKKPCYFLVYSSAWSLLKQLRNHIEFVLIRNCGAL
jgi:hypothetical protein